jgi:hypothetical protein
VERELAEQLGTSLTVVREALVQLETEGFITKHQFSDYITQLTHGEIEQILVVRRVLPGSLSRLRERRPRTSGYWNTASGAVEAARLSDCCPHSCRPTLAMPYGKPQNKGPAWNVAAAGAPAVRLQRDSRGIARRF